VSAPSITSPAITSGTWRLDPTDSLVEFHVRHFYGLMTVKGRFERYHGTLDLQSSPAVELVIEAGSLTTKRKKRDDHLRSMDFFAVEEHPYVRFVSASVALEGDVLRVAGRLHAADKDIPVELDATVTETAGEVRIHATTQVDHRELGMTWSPLGILRAPSTLVVSGRLVRD
jgi:polyisoprenoid-binding protein YceI